MKFIADELTKKLLEIKGVKYTSHPILNVYVDKITDEIQEEIKKTMDGFSCNVLDEKGNIVKL